MCCVLELSVDIFMCIGKVSFENENEYGAILQFRIQSINSKVCRCIYRIISSIAWRNYGCGKILELIIELIHLKFAGVYTGYVET